MTRKPDRDSMLACVKDAHTGVYEQTTTKSPEQVKENDIVIGIIQLGVRIAIGVIFGIKDSKLKRKPFGIHITEDSYSLENVEHAVSELQTRFRRVLPPDSLHYLVALLQVILISDESNRARIAAGRFLSSMEEDRLLNMATIQPIFAMDLRNFDQLVTMNELGAVEKKKSDKYLHGKILGSCEMILFPLIENEIRDALRRYTTEFEINLEGGLIKVGGFFEGEEEVIGGIVERQILTVLARNRLTCDFDWRAGKISRNENNKSGKIPADEVTMPAAKGMN